METLDDLQAAGISLKAITDELRRGRHPKVSGARSTSARRAASGAAVKRT